MQSNEKKPHTNKPNDYKPPIIVLPFFAANFFISSAINKSTYAPLERVKLLLQCENEIMKNKRMDSPYKGVIDCIKRTYKTEGLRSFFKGNFPSILSSFGSKVVLFSLVDKFQNGFPPTTENHSVMHNLMRNVILSSLTFGSITLFLYPFDYARVRLANDVMKDGGIQFVNMRDVFKKTLKTEGFTGLYRGIGSTFCSIGTAKVLPFCLYDITRPFMINPDNNAQGQFLDSLAIQSGVSFISGWILAYPFETVRNRMMMTNVFGQKYTNTFSAFTDIVLNEGAWSLWKGLSVVIIKETASFGFGIGMMYLLIPRIKN